MTKRERVMKDHADGLCTDYVAPPAHKKVTDAPDKSGDRTDWQTPPRVLDRVRAYYPDGIPLDPFSHPENRLKAHRFMDGSHGRDGFTEPWVVPVYANPPYSKGNMPKATAKLRDEASHGTEIVAILPMGSRFGTKYWQRDILGAPGLTAVCFVRGRVAFVDPDTGLPVKNNTYDSAIWGFNVDLARFVEAFGPLGRVVIVERVV